MKLENCLRMLDGLVRLVIIGGFVWVLLDLFQEPRDYGRLALGLLGLFMVFYAFVIRDLKRFRLSREPGQYQPSSSSRQSIYLGIDIFIRLVLLVVVLLFFLYPEWRERYWFSLSCLFLAYWGLVSKGRHEVGRWK
ncbi:hypothetical protein [Streptococcus danieliae]|uniref:Uncharacterized protein n=1 Tax=Streptococcus danieliae TaxID=747656 RepID=A0A7Z0M8A2_9STRE|nr:hypothetical protein [Streptococcus danieliae]MBF0700021.1 hypothetical protein [Streptococcus danieliae]NYS97197.1 hypothetical protein [Streptococcus danieliae]